MTVAVDVSVAKTGANETSTHKQPLGASYYRQLNRPLGEYRQRFHCYTDL